METRILQIKKDLKKFIKVKDVNFKLKILLDVENFKSKKRVLLNAGVSFRSYYRWKQKYNKQGVIGLISRKGRGRKPIKISSKARNLILRFRNNYNWGSEVIHEHLKRDHYINISISRIYRFLKSVGKVNKIRSKKRNKHTKVVKVYQPGQFCQLDIKYITHLKKGKNYYAYNFIDHASKWSYKKIYKKRGEYETKCFVSEVISKAPFSIKVIQTDNGPEFTAKYLKPDNPTNHCLFKLCKKNKIYQRLIPPGEKELNGLVEKHHHIDFKELYSKFRTDNIKKLNCSLAYHCKWRNNKRRFKSLNWVTPNEYLKTYYLNNLTKFLLILSNLKSNINPLVA